MRESVTYQDILEEGRIEGVNIGVRQGQAEGERRLLLRFATAKLGQPSAAVRAQIETISDLDTLERLADRLLTAATWDELLDGSN